MKTSGDKGSGPTSSQGELVSSSAVDGGRSSESLLSSSLGMTISYPSDGSNSTMAPGGAQRRTPSGCRGGGDSHLWRGNRNRPETRGVTSQQRKNQCRAMKFRQQTDTTHLTKLIHKRGNTEFVWEQDKMVITKHTKVLSVLNQRALRYRRRGHHRIEADEMLYNEALDETGTVDTVPLSDSDNGSSLNSCTQEPVQQFLARKGISDELLMVNGVAPGKKTVGVLRLVMENINEYEQQSRKMRIARCQRDL